MKPLSQKTKYALRALQFLSHRKSQDPILISTLADGEGIPKKFLESILLELKNHGVLQSKKGKGGGYLLRESPSEISLGKIVRIFDGTLAPLPCVSESAFVKCRECKDEETCGVRHIMKEVRDAVAAILDQTTIADLLKLVAKLEERKRAEQGDSMYYI